MNHSKTLTTAQEAKAYLKELYDNDLLFHLDDDPADMVRVSDGEPTFTIEECEMVSQRISEVFSLLKDPFEYIVDELTYEVNPTKH